MKLGPVERYVKRRKTVTTAELAQLGLSRPALYRSLASLVEDGSLVRVARGRYQVAEAHDEADSWLTAQHQYPKGVLCLLSALLLHKLTTQSPREVWLALPKSAWRKPASYPPMRLVHFSGKAFTAGIETQVRPGGAVRVYSVAKTVADCFKFRNQVGLDVAMEALREGWRERRFTLEQLDAMAKVCRVQAVIRPYVEALVA
jgi:predicted transcriptional regulator of viral defense system